MAFSSLLMFALLGLASRVRGLAPKLALSELAAGGELSEQLFGGGALAEELAGGGELSEELFGGGELVDELIEGGELAEDFVGEGGGLVEDLVEGRLDQSWQRKVSHVLRVPDIENAENQTAFVTFAGKKDLTYINCAVMLGMSIQKHAPGYPMVAIVIEGMRGWRKDLLRNSGWAIVSVPNWEADYCGPKCDLQFLGRWHDSFEKVNTFRLPFERVVFLDADTYVFSPRIKELISMELPLGHIAMAMDGCKSEYNSGVLVYRPDLALFMQMLDLVSHRERNDILDQNIINEAYRGKVVEVDREFNCVDIMGVQPSQREECKFKCSDNVVVSHFTGHPKPTAGERRLLELVRRPSSPGLACTNTNFGSCAKWSEFYCDMRLYSEKLSTELQGSLEYAGPCCHSPYDPRRDRVSCKECPALLSLTNSNYFGDTGQDVDGAFAKTTIKPDKLHGGKPIYMRTPVGEEAARTYMYYFQENLTWLIGGNYSSNAEVLAYAAEEAQCPRDAGMWHFANDDGEWEHRPLVHLRETHGAPGDPEHVALNVTLGSWQRVSPSYFLPQTRSGNRDFEHSASNVTAGSSEHGAPSGKGDLEQSASNVTSGSSEHGTPSGNGDLEHSASNFTTGSSSSSEHGAPSGNGDLEHSASNVTAGSSERAPSGNGDLYHSASTVTAGSSEHGAPSGIGDLEQSVSNVTSGSLEHGASSVKGDLEQSASNVTSSSSEHGAQGGNGDLKHSASSVTAGSSERGAPSGNGGLEHSASNVTAGSSEHGAPSLKGDLEQPASNVTAGSSEHGAPSVNRYLEHSDSTVTTGSSEHGAPSGNGDLKLSASSVTASSSERGAPSGNVDLEHSASNVTAGSSEIGAPSGDRDLEHSAWNRALQSSHRALSELLQLKGALTELSARGPRGGPRAE